MIGDILYAPRVVFPLRGRTSRAFAVIPDFLNEP
jgi:hypothetical protein